MHEFSSAQLGVNPVRFSAGSVPGGSGEVGSWPVRFMAGSVRLWFTLLLLGIIIFKRGTIGMI